MKLKNKRALIVIIGKLITKYNRLHKIYKILLNFKLFYF